MIRFLAYSAGYLWALPNTALGACAAPLVALTGGRVRFERGAMELYGGFASWFLRRICGGVGAMTLGHVILAQNRDDLNFTRDHEHVHVRQYMVWGPLFLPMYGLSSFLCWRKGLNPYLENRFERVAYALFPCGVELPHRDGGKPA